MIQINQEVATNRKNAVSLLLDRSGSMEGSEQKTVEAINGFIGQMQADKLGKDAHFTMITFDSQGFDPVRRGLMGEVKPLQPSEFVPRAATPLFDAVGDTIGKLEGEGKHIFVVLTDGLENCSKKFSQEQIRTLIETKRKAGWVVIYLGANIDAWKQAENIGVPGEMAMNYKQGATTAPPAQAGQPGLFNRFTNHVAQHPMGYALGAAAVLGLTYLTLRPGDAHAAESLGFTDVDRNASMGVDGVSQSWQDAVSEDVAAFVEPIPSDSMFDLPPEVAEAQANLPEDFDPAQGSMVDGEQVTDTGGDILAPEDVPSGESFIPTNQAVSGEVDSLADVGEVTDGVADTAGSVASEGGDILDSITSGVGSVVETAGEVASGAMEVVGNVASGAADVAGDAVSVAADLVGSIFD